MDLARPEEEKQQYAFKFMGWSPIKFARCQHNLLLRLLCKLRNGRELAETEAIYQNCDAMIDISGYALGSNWSKRNNYRYLDHLEFAYEFHIPVYLMPQSFGPFDFGVDGQAINDRIRKLLPTVKVIFAREQEGYDALVNTYGLNNVRLAPDLVLSNKGIEIDQVFRVSPEINLPDISQNSVAVIPNSMNIRASSLETVMSMYISIIEKLLDMEKMVYILSHSTVDAQLCKDLKTKFAENERVVMLEQDFSCLEFNELVKKFDYLVASRFHSIVHAFKNGVPCIALGWATKYHDLLQLFGQEMYVFDVRNQSGAEELLKGIDHMNDHYSEEVLKIRNGLSAVQNGNVFDVLLEA
jgi:colanic acid/amylovoran biosynthesis protein